MWSCLSWKLFESMVPNANPTTDTIQLPKVSCTIAAERNCSTFFTPYWFTSQCKRFKYVHRWRIRRHHFGRWFGGFIPRFHILYRWRLSQLVRILEAKNDWDALKLINSEMNFQFRRPSIEHSDFDQHNDSLNSLNELERHLDQMRDELSEMDDMVLAMESNLNSNLDWIYFKIFFEQHLFK